MDVWADFLKKFCVDYLRDKVTFWMILHHNYGAYFFKETFDQSTSDAFRQTRCHPWSAKTSNCIMEFDVISLFPEFDVSIFFGKLGRDFLTWEEISTRSNLRASRRKTLENKENCTDWKGRSLRGDGAKDFEWGNNCWPIYGQDDWYHGRLGCLKKSKFLHLNPSFKCNFSLHLASVKIHWNLSRFFPAFFAWIYSLSACKKRTFALHGAVLIRFSLSICRIFLRFSLRKSWKSL